MAVHIACAADESYVGHCAALLHSILISHSQSEIYVHYLHGPQFPLSDRNKLRSLVEGLGGHLQLLRVDDALVSDLSTMARIPQVMWYRVFLPDLLPDVDRVLYLDADTLVVDSLQPLWDEPLEGAYLAAVSNVFEPEYEDRPKLLGLPRTQTYFNSGVLLFNLADMRADDCTREIISFARRESLLWPDQDALNVVLGNKRVPLHPRWNCMNSLFTFPQASSVFGSDAVREACSDPAIVHFEGPGLAKPWHYLSKHPFRRAYRAHRAATPWPDLTIEGRTWVNRLLRPLPARTTLEILRQWPRVRARVAGHLSRWKRLA